MDSECFYGVTLNEKEPLAQFETDEETWSQKLVIKQIILGVDAKDGEFNVVQVETRKENLKIPIAVLKAGETSILKPNIEFPYASVTFKLIQGTGPVYIIGQNIVSNVDIEDMYYEEEENEEEFEENNGHGQVRSNQRGHDGKNTNNHKKK